MPITVSVFRSGLRTVAIATFLCWVATGPVHSENSKLEHYQAMRDLLGELSGKTTCDYMTYDFGRARDSRAVSVVVAEEQAFALVSTLRKQLQQGTIAFVGTNRWLGDEDHRWQG